MQYIFYILYILYIFCMLYILCALYIMYILYILYILFVLPFCWPFIIDFVTLLCACPKVWELTLDPAGFAYLSDTNDVLDSFFASDKLDASIKANAEGDTYFESPYIEGWMSELAKTNQSLVVEVLPGHDGRDAKCFDCIVFTFPQDQGGRVWVSICDVYDKMEFTMCPGTGKGLPNTIGLWL